MSFVFAAISKVTLRKEIVPASLTLAGKSMCQRMCQKGLFLCINGSKWTKTRQGLFYLTFSLFFAIYIITENKQGF